MKIISKSERQTWEVAGKLWREHKKHRGEKAIVFALEGKMGTGKTQFTKGLAKAMKIKDVVISPTFVLEAEYGGGRLVHIDAWRMEKDNELKGIGFEERIDKKQIVVIEWAEKVRGVIKKLAGRIIIVWIKFEYGKGENERIISWERL